MNKNNFTKKWPKKVADFQYLQLIINHNLQFLRYQKLIHLKIVKKLMMVATHYVIVTIIIIQHSASKNALVVTKIP